VRAACCGVAVVSASVLLLCQTECSPCKAGYACPHAGSQLDVTAMPCDVGKHAPIGSEACIPCPAGSVAPKQSASCETCSAGERRAAGLQCAVMHESALRSDVCAPIAGWYAREGWGACLPCRAGTYSDRTGSDACTSCPSGTSSSSGSTSCSTLAFYTNLAAEYMPTTRQWTTLAVIVISTLLMYMAYQQYDARRKVRVFACSAPVALDDETLPLCACVATDSG
jgi:hypothetical protein